MGIQYRPEIGDWYETASGDLFEVVALDSREGTVEIQYFDGAIEELDMETWLELELMAVEPPEDYSGSLDLAREDYGTDSDSAYRLDSHNPLDGPDLDRF
ncbi:hypothetical protein J2T57_000188 [Natronocella acetinitrilica]|uniref:Uncharacterized protein n=1 Tax=Natronocella acetinitrilica TaxID=414046 RepID=A0AAE3G087_9GAMM|nr:DUF6763 family protein [Natronocella acetinitrilica]MCP1673096.1 hypothetical protein [Natronocella acetinitrilica]